jgi:hypothetical protein
MFFTPVDLMLQRVERHSADSDATHFQELSYAGEFIIRLTTAAVVACIQDSPDRHRYSLEHRIVRADGIGEWVQVFHHALTGPAASYFDKDAYDFRRELTIKVSEDSWLRGAITDLDAVLRVAYEKEFKSEGRPSLKVLFDTFVVLRNKVRAHGAPSPATLAACVGPFKRSVMAMAANAPVAKLQWAYLHRNISGKYFVRNLGLENDGFDDLKGSTALRMPNLESGIYLSLSDFRRVNLIYSDQDSADFLFPNGQFGNNDFELHSLITDNRRREPNHRYLAPATELPKSETQGRHELQFVGEVLSNLPALPMGYVERTRLEELVRSHLENDRHQIVTLVGRGGIGKTSLALKVLHELLPSKRYNIVVWFSARDIDLTIQGVKQVRPEVFTIKDIASQYAKLLGVDDKVQNKEVKLEPIKHFEKELGKSEWGPVLFVFDNFETLQSPVDTYNWIDTYIRPPNKILITSRLRDFKGDYPVDIAGMDHIESSQLILVNAQALGIENTLRSTEIKEIYEESEGHPYIMKIILGELADRGSWSRPSKVLSNREDILNALFERTFSTLTPLEQRIFLTVSDWRSSVPQMFVSAALRRSGDNLGDPDDAIDRLVRVSMVERSVDASDIAHLTVPLAAALFGKRRLQFSSINALIKNDVQFLQSAGTSDARTDQKNFFPRLKSYFKNISAKIERKETSLTEERLTLEYFAGQFPAAWRLLSDLEQDVYDTGWEARSAEYLRRFLESGCGDKADTLEAWEGLGHLYQAQQDLVGLSMAFQRWAQLRAPSLAEISNVSNTLNGSEQIRGLPIYERIAVLRPVWTSPQFDRTPGATVRA